MATRDLEELSDADLEGLIQLTASSSRSGVPATPEVETLVNKKRAEILRRGVGADVPIPESRLPQPGQDYDAFLADLAKKRAGYESQLEKVSAPPDYEGLKAQMVERAEGALPQSMAAVLAGMGPKSARILQQSMLARGEQMRAPMKVEGGTITAEGEALIDPSFQQQRKAEMFSRRIAELDKQREHAITTREKQAIDLEKFRMEEARKRDTDRILGAIGSAVAAGQGQQGSMSISQFVDKDDGTPLAFHNKLGFVKSVQGPNGQVGYIQVPQSRAVHRVDPTATERKEQSDVRDINAGITHVIGQIDQLGKRDQRGFGIGYGAAQNIPGVGPNLVAPIIKQKVQTEDARNAYGNAKWITDKIRQSRFGQTLTALEKMSAGDYLINEFDPMPEIKRKLANIQRDVVQGGAFHQQGMQPGAAQGNPVNRPSLGTQLNTPQPGDVPLDQRKRTYLKPGGG